MPRREDGTGRSRKAREGRANDAKKGERGAKKRARRGTEAKSKRAPTATAAKSATKKSGAKKKAAKKSKAAEKSATKKTSAKKTAAKKAAAKKTATKKTATKKASAKKASAKRASAKKASAKKAATKRTGAKRTGAKTAKKAKKAKKATPQPDAASSASSALTPVAARPTRSERASAEARLAEIDRVCNAWADIVAERMAADQKFADLVEQYHLHSAKDLRGLFLWDALHAAESHVALITDVLASHLEGRRADPLAILADLRDRQRRIAAVYAVNAFLAVLNQMKTEKPKWVTMDDVDPRFAVLALAHQTLSYALEAVQVAAPRDITDTIVSATQDEAVWVWRRMPEPGTDTLAAAAAAAAFFRELGADVLTTTDEVAALYAAHGLGRG